MRTRFADHIDRLLELITSSPGETPVELRAAVQDRARRLVRGEPLARADAVPASLSPYVDAVLRHAYRITDRDVDSLRGRHTDDLIFETTVNAAVGAGVSRLERALTMLNEGDA